MRLLYFCPITAKTGYGRAAHDNAMAMIKAGIDVRICPTLECYSEDLQRRYARLLERLVPYAGSIPETVERTEPDLVVIHAPPVDAVKILPEYSVGVPIACYTTWETDSIPEDLIEGLKRFQAVIVPSRANASAFEELPVVHVVPHAIDADWWRSGHGPAGEDMAPREQDLFTFYTIGVWGERKNVEGVIKAYLSAFTRTDEVVLRLVVPRPERKRIAFLVESLNIDPVKLPRMVFYCDIADRELRRVHQTSHAYVSCSRGDAWGLGAFEAMATGRWVIYPQFLGCDDFLRNYNRGLAYPSNPTPVIVPPTIVDDTVEVEGRSVKVQKRIAPAGVNAHQHWREPHLAACQDAMHAVRQVVLAGEEPIEDTSYLKQWSYESVGAEFQRVFDLIISRTEGRRANG